MMRRTNMSTSACVPRRRDATRTWFLWCMLSLISCWWLVLPVVAQDAEPVMVIGFPKEGRMEQDGSGPYPDLVRAILAEVDTPTTWVVSPVMRSTRLFSEGGARCLVPAALVPWQNKFPHLTTKNTVESEPIDYITAHIVTKPGTAPITDLRDLAGKRIGYWVGASVDRFLPDVGYTKVTAQSEESNIRMLMSGRVDAIFNWNPDAYILFERMGYGEPSLDPDDPIFGSTAHFWCHRTRATEAFIKQADKVIREMREDGRIKNILGKHSLVVGADVPMTVWRQAPEQ